YLGTIFDHVLRQEVVNGVSGERGIRAVIVYPMNALINSQKQALDDFAEQYKTTTGSDFPITYARYTGQEDQTERDKIKEQLPHILLTNYMMLELLLTRHHEERLKFSIYKSLQFLVFDELHTYRGRQGADVAMLIRRIRAAIEHDVVCIGTSATMVSGGDEAQQKKQVAAVASKVFGKSFEPDQIIGETLAYSFASTNEQNLDSEALRDALLQPIDMQAPHVVLEQHPISIWIDRSISLTTETGHTSRRPPMTITEIAELLAETSGVDLTTCRNQLEKFLLWTAEVNAAMAEQDKNSARKRSGYLPYKIHQFISQTGAVYLSLGEAGERNVTLEPALEAEIDGTRVPLFPTVFSRLSGAEFLCVRINEDEGRFDPRGFDDTVDLENEEDEDRSAVRNMGYLIPYPDEWIPEEDLFKLPETWFKTDRNGELRLKDGLPAPVKRYEGRLPEEVSYDLAGNFSRDPKALPMRGWYMPALLLFDPTSGRIFSGNAREAGKLSRLGSEGRCSATTMLSIAILREMGKTGFDAEDQKLLSFTDNRQDAAFQAGHFNDFLRVIELRSALNHALADQGMLDFKSIDQFVFDNLDLNPENYALRPPGEFASSQRRLDETFRKFIMYRLLQDLRREWRVTVPNLESTALLKISYRDLEDNCAIDGAWANAGFLASCTSDERQEIVYQVLDYFRKSYAISSEVYLTDEALRGNQREIQERLKAPWTLEGDEELPPPKVLRLRPLGRRVPFESESAGYMSMLGRYLRGVAGDHGDEIKKADYDDFAQSIFDTLADAEWLLAIDTQDSQGRPMRAYRLLLDTIIWTAGDGEHVSDDPVRARSFRAIEQTPNSYFRRLYQTDYRQAKRLLSGEHTGQITNQDREIREKQFGEGELSALFCSPTMELGIDIKELNIVHLRNVPPNPANYAQRSGRAGRGGQPALVYTLCSSYAPHDRHYFRNSRDMVAGVVQAPKLDLGNLELLESHLHALYISRKPIAALSLSMQDILELGADGYPLSNDAKQAVELGPGEADEVSRHFLRAVSDVAASDLAKTDFFSEQWVDDTINRVSGEAGSLNRSIDRWREMYTLVQQQIEEATGKINQRAYRANSREERDLKIQLHRAERQRDLLLNDLGFS
ncbi:MAG: DEAD/DEAH box helicase, partial [Spirochaetales bacterium]|nr:DEAD/DEAH box helicase [Spirochaetales bacterium]